MSFALSKSFSVAFAAARQTIYYSSRSISQCTWKGKPAYKSGSSDQQKCIDYAFYAAKCLGFDAKGAVEGQIAWVLKTLFWSLLFELIVAKFSGGFHNHAVRGYGQKWITIQYKDDQGRVLYHRKQDGTVWDRIHIYDDFAINQTPAEMPVMIWAK